MSLAKRATPLSIWRSRPTWSIAARQVTAAGGWFLEEDGQYYLAGATSFLVHNPWSSENAMYHDIFGATRVSSYLSWIDDYVDFSEPLLGDANNDGLIDDADASILASHWQQTGGWADGDFSGDGLVNDQDASIMAAHWTEGTEAGATVPEPSTLAAVVSMAVAALLLGRRRRS